MSEEKPVSEKLYDIYRIIFRVEMKSSEKD